MRRTHRLCPNPGDLAARPAPEAGRSCRPLRPPCRPASATRHALPRRVAPHRTRPRSTHWIGPTDPRHQASTHRDRPSHGWSFRCRPFLPTHRRLPLTAPSCRARRRRARQRRSRVPHVHLSPTPATFHTPLVSESRPPRIIRARMRSGGHDAAKDGSEDRTLGAVRGESGRPTAAELLEGRSALPAHEGGSRPGPVRQPPPLHRPLNGDDVSDNQRVLWSGTAGRITRSWFC